MKTFTATVFLALAANAAADTLWQKVTNVALFDTPEDAPLDGDIDNEPRYYGTKAEKEEKKEKGNDSKADKTDSKESEKKDGNAKSGKGTDDDDKEDNGKGGKSSKSSEDDDDEDDRKGGKSTKSSEDDGDDDEDDRKGGKSTKSSGDDDDDSTSTSTSSNDRTSRSCINKKEPSVKDGKYKFKLYKNDARCADSKDRKYQYGQFDKVKEFSGCAKKCVEDTGDSLRDDLMGFDWNCDKKECRCIYDEGALNRRNSGDFDKENRDLNGEGKVKGGSDSDDWYCAKLTKSPDNVAEVQRRGLRA